MRPRACCTRESSSATSGTTRLAASVGVEARRSATSSSSGRSFSCPIALTSGVTHAAAVRTRRLVAEDEEVLEVAAAAGDDDDVHLRVGVELADGGGDLGGGPVALHGGVANPELHRRPAQLGVAQHVLLGVRVLAGDQADAAGQEGQRHLAVEGEQPLLGELASQPLEPLEQVAESDVPQLVDLHREACRP